jgi:predicted MFS family arabinose efflux permease
VNLLNPWISPTTSSGTSRPIAPEEYTLAGSANAALLGAGGLGAALPARFLVGAALAGVYAPGVRLVASHFERARGTATAVVVGALTVGSGLPHLVRGVRNVPWQATIVATSALTVLAALAVRSVPVGPSAPAGTPPLDLRAGVRALRDRPIRLTTLGYMGHMWELYAVWAWLPTFFAASRTDAGRPLVAAVAFAAIGAAGFVGAVGAGLVADRVGRPATTTFAMLTSAACCLVSLVAFAAPTPALVALLLVWGAAVIADSAQFSAATTELAKPSYAGSALTLQLALGFALTIASIRLVPLMARAIGWRFALVPLGAGPVAGALATMRLSGGGRLVRSCPSNL